MAGSFVKVYPWIQGYSIAPLFDRRINRYYVGYLPRQANPQEPVIINIGGLHRGVRVDDNFEPGDVLSVDGGCFTGTKKDCPDSKDFGVVLRKDGPMVYDLMLFPCMISEVNYGPSETHHDGPEAVADQ